MCMDSALETALCRDRSIQKVKKGELNTHSAKRKGGFVQIDDKYVSNIASLSTKASLLCSCDPSGDHRLDVLPTGFISHLPC